MTCPRCDRSLAGQGLEWCEKHREAARGYSNPEKSRAAYGRKAALRSDDVCHECDSPPVDGKTRCAEHLARASERSADYYRRNAAEVALRARTVHRDTRRNNALVRNYGITLSAYNAMLAEQGGVCAICRKPESRVDRHGVLHALAVDHCHKTGAVRGLLCHRCNRVLGLMGDDASMLVGAAGYLEDQAMSVTNRVLRDMGVVS